MNVKPIPTLDDRINEIRTKTADIVNEWILPNESKLWGLGRNGEVTDHQRREALQLREEIKEQVWQAGLWAPHLPKECWNASTAVSPGASRCRRRWTRRA